MASQNDSGSITEARTIEQHPLPAGTMNTTEVNAITENAPISPHELDRIETPGDAQPEAEEHTSDHRNSAYSTSDEDGKEANRERGIKDFDAADLARQDV